MSKKLLHITKYVLYSIFSAAFYGSLMYFAVYRMWANGSALTAYLMNIGFIVFSLTVDKIIRVLLAGKMEINEKSRKLAKFMNADSSISFKTAIYLFYTFILIISQMSVNGFTFMGEDFMAFALSIEYCVLLVIAFDTFIGHLSKDMERTERIAEKIAKYKSDNE